MTDPNEKNDVCENLRKFLEKCNIDDEVCHHKAYQWYVNKCDSYETKEQSETSDNNQPKSEKSD